MPAYTTRQPLITPTGTKEEIGKIEAKLFEINDVLYIAANLIVADCVNEYWEMPDDKVPYLVHQKTVDSIETDLVSQIKELHSKGITVQQTEELRKVIGELKEAKESFIRKTQKHELWEECKGKDILVQLARKFPVVPHNILLQTVFRITQQFLKELANMRARKYKVPYFTKGFPIPFGFDDMLSPFFTKEGKADIYFKWIDGIEFKFDFGKDKSRIREVINRFLSGELDYKNLGDSTIKIDKHRERIYLHLVLKEPPKPPKPLKKNLCLGIDVGYSVPAYWALSDFSDAGALGNGKALQIERDRFSTRLKGIASSLTSARGGHGKTKKLQAMRTALRKKERDYFKNLNREFAKTIVDTAIQKGAGVIKMELLDFSEERKKLGKVVREVKMEDAKKGIQGKEYNEDWLLQHYRFWSYGQLQRFIQQRAEKHSIEVVYIDKRHTSKLCHVCKRDDGHRPKKPNHEYLIFDQRCMYRESVCPLREKTLKMEGNVRVKKWVLDADKNAAFNIAASEKVMRKFS